MSNFGLTAVSVLYLLISCAGAQSTDSCKSEEYNKNHGTITSPDYPAHYPTNFCKDWFITGNTNDIITISFKMFDVETGILGNCGRDYLEIGPHPKVKLCGNTSSITSRVYISTAKHVRIHFSSDYMTTGAGFELMYIMGPLQTKRCEQDQFRCHSGKCIFNEWRCNGLAECEDHSDEANCPHETHSTTPPTTHICTNSTLLCEDIGTGRNRCIPKAQWCDGEKDCLHGEDEDSKLCPSFKCNSHIDSQTGFVVSPNFPHDYPNNLSCTWTIHVQDTKAQVQLRFIKFELQKEAGTDFLTVYDGTYHEGKVIGVYFGGLADVPTMVESTTDYVTLKFTTNRVRAESGFNITFQKKGVCLPDQSSCGTAEKDCFPTDKACDGVWNCRLHGGDEKGCGGCDKEHFRCGLKGSHQCYEEKQRCNGISRCAELDDELNCNSVLCGSHNGTFLCDNKRCIYETWKCDKTNDCGDNSDETDCPRSTNLITIAAVAGSLICALLLVVAMGCTCKLYNLRMQQFHGPRHETPLTRMYAEFMRRRAPPPYHEAMLTSRPYDEVRQELAEQNNQNETAGSRTRRHRRRTARLPHRQQIASNSTAGQSSQQNDSCSTDTTSNQQTEGNQGPGESSQTINSSNLTWNTDSHSSTLALIPDNSSDTTEGPDESGDESDQPDGEHVSFSRDIGITARWQRPRNSGKESSSSECQNLLQADPPDSPLSAGRGSGDVTTTSCDSVDPSSIITENTNTRDSDNESDKSCDTDLLGASSSLLRQDESLISFTDRGLGEAQHETSDSSSDTDAITMGESSSHSELF
ncbi:low-density lipoprotein receptor-related protein 12-like [Mizuhopecten yessoensis]|uniref:low-density lipoprotein receptor-related protein 12-like n=1 Tax=Mizuhopecten yessoensis TaxID=6573 RepID=UPI000B45DC1F|nr:low-density lipoprotein receptor-related protein 12-like [Mizuhopecten yessoensis]